MYFKCVWGNLVHFDAKPQYCLHMEFRFPWLANRRLYRACNWTIVTVGNGEKMRPRFRGCVEVGMFLCFVFA